MKPSFIEADMTFSIPKTKTLIRVGNKDHVDCVVVPEHGAPEIVVMESGDRSAVDPDDNYTSASHKKLA